MHHTKTVDTQHLPFRTRRTIHLGRGCSALTAKHHHRSTRSTTLIHQLLFQHLPPAGRHDQRMPVRNLPYNVVVDVGPHVLGKHNLPPVPDAQLERNQKSLVAIVRPIFTAPRSSNLGEDLFEHSNPGKVVGI
jgi:hypothetical protein